MMKNSNLLTLVALILLSTTSVWAQQVSEGVYTIRAPRFAKGLVEKWITEYNKVDSRMHIVVAAPGTKADINFSVFKDDNDDHTIWFGQYAILPVTARQGEAAQYFAHHKLSKKKLRELFFVSDDIEESLEEKHKHGLVAYSCSHAHCLSNAFASYFGQSVANLNGKKISGDDVFLTTAINRDKEGISFNALYNLYDLGSRKLKSDVSIIPLDVKKQQAQILNDETTVDGLIALLESESVDGIPVQSIGLSVGTTDDEILNGFLTWVVTVGKDYNHEFGLLNIDDKQLAAETGKLTKKLLTAQK